VVDSQHLNDLWPLPGSTDLRDRLLAAYGDEARGYHDLRQLAEVLDHVELLKSSPPPRAAGAEIAPPALPGSVGHLFR
jgi:predicted metal-dependent HD superfamily phosphohydrolase